jgi:pimeloyl-ACP methyl ester carboxylesterase
LAIGVHHFGIDEPRAISLARAFASVGVTVLSVEFPELVDYRFDPVTIESIAVSARYLAKETGRVASGVVGISVAGGLALLAAADPASQKPIGFVVALGAHCDLNRVVRYFAGDPVRDPSGHVYPVSPHPYGARVLLFGYLDKLFSPEDLPAARDALRLYLHDQHREARLSTKLLSESGRERMLRILDEGNIKEVGNDLVSAANASRSALARVSPCGKLARLNVPVYLIHGVDDPIIPSTETLWLAREVPRTELRWVLVSPVLRHAELGQKFALLEYWKLVSFFADLLSQAHHLPYAFGSE